MTKVRQRPTLVGPPGFNLRAGLCRAKARGYDLPDFQKPNDAARETLPNSDMGNFLINI